MRQKACVHTVIFVLLLLWAFPSVGFQGSQGANNPISQESIQARTRIPCRDGSILIAADEIVKSGQMLYASGKVRIAVEDITQMLYALGKWRIAGEDITITGDEAEYDSTAQTLKASGHTTITQGQSRAVGFRCEIHLDQHPPKILIMK